jgi:hypothetical protein
LPIPSRHALLAGQGVLSATTHRRVRRSSCWRESFELKTSS